MTGKRTIFFLILYAAILAAMLFVFLFAQGRYGADTSGPYKRRFLDKFFLQAPAHTVNVLTDLRYTPLLHAGAGTPITLHVRAHVG